MRFGALIGFPAALGNPQPVHRVYRLQHDRTCRAGRHPAVLERRGQGREAPQRTFPRVQQGFRGGIGRAGCLDAENLTQFGLELLLPFPAHTAQARMQLGLIQEIEQIALANRGCFEAVSTV